MLRNLVKSKIQRLVITDKNLKYEGSLALDAGLLRLSDILPSEVVQVVNVNNGARFETYAIDGPRKSRCCCVNGAAARLVDFGVAFVILLGMIFAFGIALTPKVLLLPLFLLLLLVCALGFGLWLGAINVYIRDVQMLIPFLVQIWQYASPVIYSAQSIPSAWRLVYALNPMAGVLSGFRWCLLPTIPPGPEIWPSVIVAILVFITGIMMFLRVQRTMVDIL